MKKHFILTILVIFAMLCQAQNSWWDGSIADSYNGGDGTAENPYQIATVEQLALLAYQTDNGIGGDACYILTNDISLYGSVMWNPIGEFQDDNNYDDAIGFTGVFDGNGHSISDMNFYNNNGSGGLFAYTDGATIKNLKIVDSDIRDLRWAGFITAWARNTNISDCTVDSRAASYIDGEIHHNGGLVGTLSVTNHENDTILIRNCVNNADILGYEGDTITEYSRIGGIIGELSIDTANVVVIENCTNNGSMYSECYIGGIVGYKHLPGHCIIRNCNNYGQITTINSFAGGIMARGKNTCIFENCINQPSGTVKGLSVGGIVGDWSGEGCMSKCVNNANIIGYYNIMCYANTNNPMSSGGLAGCGGNISNCYNTGDVSFSAEYWPGYYDYAYIKVGGIVGGLYTGICYNNYNTGSVTASYYDYSFFGIMIGSGTNDQCRNLYWLGDYEYPVCGDSLIPVGSCAFSNGSNPTNWILDEPQYGTSDLIEALNSGSNNEAIWLEDVNFINNGLPILSEHEPTYPKIGAEWYYSITNNNNVITYQHLECVADTTIDNKRAKIIVKSNTLYDKDFYTTVTHEYVYSENRIVYWWDKQSQSYTILYDFNANIGDQWTIHVGDQNITIHVDDVHFVEYNGNEYKVLTVSDNDNIFSGDIICGVGHTTSLFPEKILNNQDFSVNDLRCYWLNGIQQIQFGNVDCAQIYNNFSVNENETAELSAYPNPANDFIIIKSDCSQNQSADFQYVISNLTGQIIIKGIISDDNQQIDISTLPSGIYFLTTYGKTIKIIKN